MTGFVGGTNLENTESMFKGCSSLKKLDLFPYNTKNAESFREFLSAHQSPKKTPISLKASFNSFALTP